MRSQSVTRGVGNFKSMGMISDTPTPGYSQDSRCFGQFQHVDGASQRKNLNNRTACYVVRLSSLSRIRKEKNNSVSEEGKVLCLRCVLYPLSGQGNFGLHSTPSDYSSFYRDPFPTPNLGIIPLCEQREFITNHETQKLRQKNVSSTMLRRHEAYYNDENFPVKRI